MKTFFYFYYLFGASVTLFSGLYFVISFSEGNVIHIVHAICFFFAMFNFLLASVEMRRAVREDK